MTKMKKDVYQIVTDQIIAKLEEVDANWQKPWFNVGRAPYNATSGRAYSHPLNYLTLNNPQWTSKAYCTFNKWKEQNCYVNKGEKGNMVISWFINETKDKAGKVTNTFPMLKFYTVFNSEQVTGDFARKLETDNAPTLNDHTSHENTESLIYGYLKSQALEVKQGDQAYYHFGMNEHISMPALGQFDSAENYYSTFLHEITHSTGADHRLKRDFSGLRGSTEYAFEELVAELGAAMLCSVTGVSSKPREDHAQYIKQWLRILKDDKKAIVRAASLAGKAVKFVETKAAIIQPAKVAA